MALGTTFQIIADGAARDRAVEARRAALLVAKSELAAVGSEIPLAPGRSSGQAGDMVWRVEITPYADGVDSAATGGLLRVAVAVGPRAGGTDLVELDSLRLGPAAG
jgi:general secretion pathway protein I